jgi:mannose-6-phosphate isomerase-like protein (cupin superfamily)
MMKIRRVVLGQAAGGRKVVLGDEDLLPTTVTLFPGAEFLRVWGSDGTPELPVAASADQPKNWFPPTGGFRFAFVTLPPSTLTMPDDLDMAAALAEFSEKLPGLAEVMEPDNPGMHTTDTVDVVLIVSGQATLDLGNGDEMTVETGDCVVQNGTRHAWRNHTSQPCTMASAIFGARRTA